MELCEKCGEPLTCHKCRMSRAGKERFKGWTKKELSNYGKMMAEAKKTEKPRGKSANPRYEM